MKSTMKILSLIVLITISISSSLNTRAQENIKGGFVHSVFFWLKNPDKQSDRDKIEERQDLWEKVVVYDSEKIW